MSRRKELNSINIILHLSNVGANPAKIKGGLILFCKYIFLFLHFLSSL
jgi:hypothetical protein